MQTVDEILALLELDTSLTACFSGSWSGDTSSTLVSTSPVNGQDLATIALAGDREYEQCVQAAQDSFLRWRMVPAPKRGELVYEIGQALRDKKEALGALISWEMGKILPEGLGEVQEAIDIADYAVGLSRQLYGYSMHSERPQHRMYEQWHPLGPVGVITAFNFPIAVWAWNAMIALVCGNSVLWKPSNLTPLTAIATTKLCAKITASFGFPGLLGLLIDDNAQFGKRLSEDSRIPLISATGSCRMGRAVGETVAKRFGRSILELGGNNAILIENDANLDLALRAVLFGAVGTAGQRCTSTRRLFLHSDIYEDFLQRLTASYAQIPIGNPLDSATLCGPLITHEAVITYQQAIKSAEAQGGKLLYGGCIPKSALSNCYVTPTIIAAQADMPIVSEETFAPILYVMKYDSLEHAITLQNSVPQGLSSAIFTSSVASSELFLSSVGSDCGIANVNIGTSGAEIGGAFGGEKETGGGREAGSDSWKAYMRRQTNTINWGKDLPLAQGVTFS